MALSGWTILAAISLPAVSSGDAKSAAGAEPVAVVELFTSEGCSSCPPAEQFLGEIAREAVARRRRILPIEFHVDYWNHLGWKDPFSSALYTERQRRYVRASGANGAYTPQMIVNGTEEFVGSDRARARRAIDAALSRPAATTVEASVHLASGAARIRYEIRGTRADAEVGIVLVESGLVSHVRGGENDGRTLEHTSVARGFITRPVGNGSGTVDLELAPATTKTRRAIVVFVQDPKTMAILGATDVAL